MIAVGRWRGTVRDRAGRSAVCSRVRKLPARQASRYCFKKGSGREAGEEQSGMGREDQRCAPESGSSLPDRRVADTVLAEPRERSSPAIAPPGKHADAHTYGPLARSYAVDGAIATLRGVVD